MFGINQSLSHLDELELPRLQMGQPVMAARQRQQTDDLPPDQGHGYRIEREVQWEDFETFELQAMG